MLFGICAEYCASYIDFMKITGEYSLTGYIIFADGVEFYTAGNNPRDSKQPAQGGKGLPLATLRDFCINTAKDIAKEQHAEFGGVEEVDPE